MVKAPNHKSPDHLRQWLSLGDQSELLYASPVIPLHRLQAYLLLKQFIA